jgi:hypothetical protein
MANIKPKGFYIPKDQSKTWTTYFYCSGQTGGNLWIRPDEHDQWCTLSCAPSWKELKEYDRVDEKPDYLPDISDSNRQENKYEKEQQ